MGSAWSSLGTGTAAVALYARGNRKSALVCALLFLAIRYRKGIIAYLVVRHMIKNVGMPKKKYSEVPPPPALDYTVPESWAARPGKDSLAELVPAGEAAVASEDRLVDCFYGACVCV